MTRVYVSGGFQQLDTPDVRFLYEAASIGSVHMLLWSDQIVQRTTGTEPKFPLSERKYFCESLRYVDRLTPIDTIESADTLPLDRLETPGVWVVDTASDSDAKREFCQANGLEYRVIRQQDLEGFPEASANVLPPDPSTKKVIVTGCYDWFHSGHVRFFEEVSELGSLYVVVGHDANIKLLKGEGHPMFSEDRRRFMAQAVRFVKQAFVSSGNGWLDAEPEIERIQPDIYAVNEDGDRPEKREYCETHGIEYRVLKRLPKEGLTARQSTDLRGF